MGEQGLGVDEDVAQGQGVDAQGEVADVHEMDAQRGRQAQLPQRGALPARRRLGDQRQIAQDALQTVIFQSLSRRRC